ncbi:hypothetical protein vseg_001915 [Gypsophila vaccaria]
MASSLLHVALFPFMAKGHMIPLLQLVKLIHNHRSNAKFTIFTTPANEPFILSWLSSLPIELINIVSFPFPPTSEIPSGVESTDKLPSISLFYPFVYVLERLRPDFEIALEGLQSQQHPVTCLVSDGFLYWTQEVVSEYKIPRLAFYGMNNYSFVLYTTVASTRPFLKVESESEDELITIPEFPWLRVTRNDFDSPWNQPVPEGPVVEFMVKCGIATSNSYALLVNSFYELESQYLDYWNKMLQPPKAWCIGPLCLADSPKLEGIEKPNWIDWLDKKWAEKKPVLYVAFGTQSEIPSDQLVEIIIGLENSGIDFLWALRIKPNQEKLIAGLQERVEGRGLIVREWVDQRMILNHEGVQGYLSHCGWNSVTESVCASVPILAWPMIAEQHLNARLIVEEMNVGLRVETYNGSVRGFVKAEHLKIVILELMVGEKGKVVRKNVDLLAEVAKKTIEEGGSSWKNLESLLAEFEINQTSM